MARNKKSYIKYIQKIITDFGPFSINEIPNEETIVLTAVSKDHVRMIERVGNKGVSVTTYVHDSEIDTDEVPYEDLPIDVLRDLELVVQNYEADCLQTKKRISN